MKKKHIALCALMCMIMMLSGCGNMSLGMGNYEYAKIHIDTHNYSGCLLINEWHDNSTGIEVETKDFGSLYPCEGMYMLVEDRCPICDATEEE